jgi:hypothetical protein
MIQFARAQAAKQAPNLTHPQLCLDAIQAGIEHGGVAGLAKVRCRQGPNFLFCMSSGTSVSYLTSGYRTSGFRYASCVAAWEWHGRLLG